MPHLPYFLMVYTAFMHRFVIYICQMSWQKNKIKLPAPPNITNRQKQDRKMTVCYIWQYSHITTLSKI